MRPVTIVVPLPPSYRGGTEEYAYRVVERISSVVPTRVVTTCVRWGHDAHPLPTGSADLTTLPAQELMERPVVISPRAREQLRSLVESSSLVHLHMPFPMVERWVTRWGASVAVPVVLTYHMDANLSGSGFGRVARAAYRTLSARPALRAASAVVSNSLGYARASPVLSRFIDKVVVIPKGVDPVRLQLELRNQRELPELLRDRVSGGPDEFRILFVGRLVPYKGLFVLIDAVHRLERTGFSFHLYIAGRGPEEARLRSEVVSRGLQSRVTLLGFVPDESLAALYRWADVVVVPSTDTMESTATALEEAASVGTPTLGSALPGAQETIPDDGCRGLLVPPGDAAALAEGFRKLRSQPRPPPPEHPRTWDEVASDYLRLYSRLSPELQGVSVPPASPTNLPKRQVSNSEAHP